MDAIRFQKVGEIPVPSDGYSLVAKSVASDDSQLFLFIEPTGTAAVTETYPQVIGNFSQDKNERVKTISLVYCEKRRATADNQPAGTRCDFSTSGRFPEREDSNRGPKMLMARRTRLRSERHNLRSEDRAVVANPFGRRHKQYVCRRSWAHLGSI